MSKDGVFWNQFLLLLQVYTKTSRESLRQNYPSKELLSPRNGPALMCLLISALSHWLGVAHGKYGLNANGVMDQSTAYGLLFHHTSYSQRSEKHILMATTESIIIMFF